MTGKPTRSTQARRTASLILIAVGLFIPALSLVPLGSLWLWQHGYLLYWTAFAFAAVTIVYLTQRRYLPAQAQPAEAAARSHPDTVESAATAGELGWSPQEELAWNDVKTLAREADPARLASTDGLAALAKQTIEKVAGRLHEGRDDPIWQFTTPEALAIAERVSRRLRMFVLESMPFGDRLTIAQALALYRWRGAVDVAERAYDIWRIVRLANPATAAANEAREQLSKAMVQWGRDAIARRLVEAYVLEVGRAAIDLYGGRLRVSSTDLAGYVSDETAADEAVLARTRAEPLRILIAGQTGAGKSSLVNALARKAGAATDALPTTSAFTPYAIEREGFPAALLIDSPGLASDLAALDEFLEKATDADLVLWVVATHRADRDIDRSALEKLRLHFAARLNRRRPPIILVLTHIDRLRPFNEWAPPYQLANDEREKARNIREATSANAEDLGFAPDEIVVVSLADPANPYNVDLLWHRIAEALPEAMRAQLLRCLNDLRDSWSWKDVWSQASGAGRTIAGAWKSQQRR
jgi:predicted GTPase